MDEPIVTMSVRRPAHDVSVIDIGGDVTAFAESAMADAFKEASSDGVHAVVLNFAGMEYMNSGGIGLLVTTLIRAQRNGQVLRATGLGPHYREILSLTRLDEAIAVYDDERAAVAHG